MSFTSYAGKYRPLKPTEARVPQRYRGFVLGDILQCFLVGIGLFGQQALVLAATGMNLDSRTLTVPGRALVLGLAITTIVVLLFRPSHFRLSWHLAAFLLFWGTYGARILLEASTRIDVVTETGIYTNQYIAMMAIGGCFLPSLAVLVNSCWSWQRITRIAAIALAVFSSLAMLKFYGSHVANFQNRMSAGTEVGDVVAIHPLALGYQGAALTLFGLHNFILRGGSLWIRSYFSVALTGVGLFLLVGSASRGPLLALMMASIVLLASQASKLDFKQILLIGLAIVIGCIGLVVLVNITGSHLFSRLTATPEAVAGGGESASRIDIYAKALSQISEHPMMGKSLTVRDEAGVDMYPHNLLLDSLISTGLLGTVPLVCLLCAGMFSGWRILARFTSLGWIPLLYFLFLGGSMFSGAIYSNSQLWISLVATLSCDAWTRRVERATLK